MNPQPVIERLQQQQAWCWLNPLLADSQTALTDVGLTADDVADASARLQRFAPYLALVFPETAPNQGIIESDIQPIPHFFAHLATEYQIPADGQFWVKRDSHLPISGSIKARGGIYEVLKFAETIAQEQGLLNVTDNYAILAQPGFRDFFSHYKIAVGSTGNLGLSIGIMSSKLGFQTTVHMSADARAWKKAMLRAHGVHVIEYDSDYSVAVTAGRTQAARDPTCHFVDDEHSADLFLGYAVAAERLKQQLDAQHIRVDSKHPLFVYLPCGVGGGPGGVTFGLKLIFGDDVHCFFAEPTHSPCMLLGLATQRHEQISVQDIGLDNQTAADGLAVGRPSGFVGRALNRLISGVYTLADTQLYQALRWMHDLEDQQLEPSAMAGYMGPVHLLDPANPYCSQQGLDHTAMRQATHLMWATGGSMVPPDEMRAYLNMVK
jgi:D-serine dehydratase